MTEVLASKNSIPYNFFKIFFVKIFYSKKYCLSLARLIFYIIYKNIYYVLLSSCSLLLLCGCAQENLTLENNNVERGSSNPNRITLKEALKTSDKLFRTLEGKTRSAGRVVESVSYLADEKTRGSGGSVDTMF